MLDETGQAEKIVNVYIKKMRGDIVFRGLCGDELLFGCMSSGAAYTLKLIEGEIMREVKKEIPRVKKVKIEVIDCDTRNKT